MKFIYLTSKSYPASTADHFYVRDLAKAFSRLLGNSFVFITANDSSSELNGVNKIDLKLNISRFRTLYYLIWFPLFILKDKTPKKELYIFSNDPNLLLVCIFWKKIFGFKYTVVSDWHMIYSRPRLDRFIMENSNFLITTSNKLKKEILSRSSINESRVLTVYGGIDMNIYKGKDKAELRDSLALPKDKKIITYAGFFKTMGMDKGIPTMIESLKYLDKDIIMLFVGGKDYEMEEYKKQASSIGMLDRCIFLGKYPLEKLVEYEQASDVLTIPYPDKPHFRNYGFPMKVYECMASGNIIVYSNLELVEEVIGDCAVSFKPGDALDFSRAIKYVFSNKEEILRLSNVASSKVKEYTWDKKAQNIISFIKNEN